MVRAVRINILSHDAKACAPGREIWHDYNLHCPETKVFSGDEDLSRATSLYVAVVPQPLNLPHDVDLEPQRNAATKIERMEIMAIANYPASAPERIAPITAIIRSAEIGWYPLELGAES